MEIFFRDVAEEANEANLVGITQSEYISIGIDGWSTIARQSIFAVTVVTSCERTFSVMSWLNSARRNCITLDNLALYTKCYIYLRTKRKIKEFIESSDKCSDSLIMFDNQEFISDCAEEGVGIARSHRRDSAALKVIMTDIASIFETENNLYQFPNQEEKEKDYDNEDYLAIFGNGYLFTLTNY